MLVKAGGKKLPMIADNYGDSCLWIAAQNGHVGVAKVQSLTTIKKRLHLEDNYTFLATL